MLVLIHQSKQVTALIVMMPTICNANDITCCWYIKSYNVLANACSAIPWTTLLRVMTELRGTVSFPVLTCQSVDILLDIP